MTLVPNVPLQADTDFDALHAEIYSGNTDDPAPENTEIVKAEEGGAQAAIVANEATNATPAEPDVAKELSDLKHKYSVLQGKYKAEIAPAQQLMQENQRLKTELASLTLKLDSAASTANQASGEEQKPVNEKLDKALNDLSDNFDPELAKGMKSVIDAAIPEQSAVTGNSDADLQNQAQQKVINFVAKEVGGKGGQAAFVQIDEDKAFNAWLSQVDPFSQTVRRTSLENYFNMAKQALIDNRTEDASKSAVQCVNIYRAWLDQASPDASDQNASKDETTNSGPPLDVDTSRSSSGELGGEAKGKVVTIADMEAFYKEQTHNPGKYREEEWARREEELYAALQKQASLA